MFTLTYVNYGILHATRSAWSLASRDFITLYGFKEGTVSDMNATFLFFYAIGGFFLSHLGDRFSKRKLIAVMYTLIAIVEVILGSLAFI
jgi:sugar phosphate permease